MHIWHAGLISAGKYSFKFGISELNIVKVAEIVKIKLKI